MAPSWTIAPLCREASSRIQHRIDNKTKPLGALGRLEEVASQLALIQQRDHLAITQPTMLVFAADHGIASHGVSIAPSAVTRQMVLNFLAGGAAINCFCRANDMALQVVDAGILEPIDDERLIQQRLGAGTADISVAPAMSRQQAEMALQLGSALAKRLRSQGSNLLACGEMGIGNTSSAAALLAALCQLPVSDCVGRGTGIDDGQLQRKISLITQAVARTDSRDDPIALLAQLGGYEIAQITGAMLGAAEAGMTLLVDGFIVTAAALLATRINPVSREYMIFAHGSAEAAHGIMLAQLQARPLLDLGLRLGEGTGAALALPLLRAACCFYNEMASFDEAGVTV